MNQMLSKKEKIRDLFIKNKVNYKYFKGNILIEFQNVTKDDGTPLKYLLILEKC